MTPQRQSETTTQVASVKRSYRLVDSPAPYDAAPDHVGGWWSINPPVANNGLTGTITSTNGALPLADGREWTTMTRQEYNADIAAAEARGAERILDLEAMLEKVETFLMQHNDDGGAAPYLVDIESLLEDDTWRDYPTPAESARMKANVMAMTQESNLDATVIQAQIDMLMTQDDEGAKDEIGRLYGLIADLANGAAVSELADAGREVLKASTVEGKLWSTGFPASKLADAVPRPVVEQGPQNYVVREDQMGNLRVLLDELRQTPWAMRFYEFLNIWVEAVEASNVPREREMDQ